MSQRKAVVSLLTVTVVAIGIGMVVGTALNQGAEAAGGKVGDPRPRPQIAAAGGF